ncbi:MAG TPA: 16S rRNA (guanine(527)-N(7))-methyltransferase RsmG [Stellaceae bacterium]|nr:16S rRNA (guanine(527)-N(7))-methyltransferase RsmG [Stellaceae bacterium]
MSGRRAINDRPVRTALGQEGFGRLSNVSRETLDRLGLYVELLRAWNRRINLVGRSTIGDVWRRHVLDSAQLQRLLPSAARVLVDVGSGAGLPGLILAILGVPEVHLIESDLRKAAFLREAIRVTGAPATLHAMRSERVPPFAADAVTARALAPLSELLDIVEPFVGPHSICVFLCGRTVEEELTLARKAWKMKVERLPSASDPSGTILRIGSLAREP